MAQDVIDHLTGITPGSKLESVRALRTQARDQAQASYLALFTPAETADMSLTERHALAAYVAGLHGTTAIAAFYANGAPELAASIAEAASTGASHGPYGTYPSAALAAENTPGPSMRLSSSLATALGPRLTAACEHAHMLVFHPRDAAPAHLQALLDAGWSTTGIVTLSQLVAFLSFQIRTIEGLRVLAATA